MVTVVADSGQGRATVFLFESSEAERYKEELVLVGSASSKFRQILLSLDAVAKRDWRDGSRSLTETLASLAVRQAHLVSFGSASAVALSFAIQDLRTVRTLSLINPAVRSHPSRHERFIDWLESRLPLGLPFRLRSDGFYSPPYLHRIRCPAAVINNVFASPFEISQAVFLAQRLPTAWYLQMKSTDEFVEAIERVHGLPAKCPQKTRRGSQSGENLSALAAE